MVLLVDTLILLPDPLNETDIVIVQLSGRLVADRSQLRHLLGDTTVVRMPVLHTYCLSRAFPVTS